MKFVLESGVFKQVSLKQPPRNVRPTTDPPPHLPMTTFVQLQRRLTQNRLRAVDDVREAVQIRRAADEASTLSWRTGFPMLTYPALFEEKSAEAVERTKRQPTMTQRLPQLPGRER